MSTEPNEKVYPDPMRAAAQSHSNQEPWNLEAGLTKREYFASIAMQGFIATGQYRAGREIADEAVHCADMLIERLNQ